MASHSRSSKNREMSTFDLENLDYGERNQINDFKLEEDDEVEIMGSDTSPSNSNPTTKRKLNSPVWLFFTLNAEKTQAKYKYVISHFLIKVMEITHVKDTSQTSIKVHGRSGLLNRVAQYNPKFLLLLAQVLKLFFIIKKYI